MADVYRYGKSFRQNWWRDVMKSFGGHYKINSKLIRIIKNMYKNCEAKINDGWWLVWSKNEC